MQESGGSCGVLSSIPRYAEWSQESAFQEVGVAQLLSKFAAIAAAGKSKGPYADKEGDDADARRSEVYGPAALRWAMPAGAWLFGNLVSRSACICVIAFLICVGKYGPANASAFSTSGPTSLHYHAGGGSFGVSASMPGGIATGAKKLDLQS